MTIAIATPTGHIGARVVQTLIDAKQDLVVLARKPENLPEAVRRKAKVAQGSLEDATFLKQATEGSQALLWVTPPNFSAPDPRAFMLGLANNAAAAIRANHIARVVNVSSHGAGQPNLGLVEWIGEVEKVLDGAAANIVHLRAGSFMENLLNQVPVLRQGLFIDPSDPAVSMPHVATRDIADVAAKWLMDGTWTGHKLVPVSGPKDLNLGEVVATLSKVLGKTIVHQRVPYDAIRESFLKRGASPAVAEAYRNMVETFGSGKVKEERRTPEATTPTTLEQFAREVLKPVVENA